MLQPDYFYYPSFAVPSIFIYSGIEGLSLGCGNHDFLLIFDLSQYDFQRSFLILFLTYFKVIFVF